MDLYAAMLANQGSKTHKLCCTGGCSAWTLQQSVTDPVCAHGAYAACCGVCRGTLLAVGLKEGGGIWILSYPSMRQLLQWRCACWGRSRVLISCWRSRTRRGWHWGSTAMCQDRVVAQPLPSHLGPALAAV